jgi:hypothetical protein
LQLAILEYALRTYIQVATLRQTPMDEISSLRLSQSPPFPSANKLALTFASSRQIMLQFGQRFCC